MFNEKLQNDFKFIIKCQRLGQENKMEWMCTVCGAIFNIDYGGKSDINQHIKTYLHKVASNAHKFQKVCNHFCTKTFNEYQKHLAANEGIFAYHICKHNQRIR